MPGVARLPPGAWVYSTAGNTWRMLDPAAQPTPLDDPERNEWALADVPGPEVPNADPKKSGEASIPGWRTTRGGIWSSRCGAT